MSSLETPDAPDGADDSAVVAAGVAGVAAQPESRTPATAADVAPMAMRWIERARNAVEIFFIVVKLRRQTKQNLTSFYEFPKKASAVCLA
jgi:hypothetical protein